MPGRSQVRSSPVGGTDLDVGLVALPMDAVESSYVDNHQCGLIFCSLCGSTICGIVGGVIHGVTLGCVNGDHEVTLARHIYVGSKASWEIIPDGVVQYYEDVPENE